MGFCPWTGLQSFQWHRHARARFSSHNTKLFRNILHASLKNPPSAAASEKTTNLFFITLLPSFRPTFRKLIGPSPCPPPPLPSFSDGTERINIKPWSGPFQPPGLDKNERRRPLSAWIKTPIKTVDHRPRRPNWKAFSILLAVEKNRRARTKKRNRSRKSG